MGKLDHGKNLNFKRNNKTCENSGHFLNYSGPVFGCSMTNQKDTPRIYTIISFSLTPNFHGVIHKVVLQMECMQIVTMVLVWIVTELSSTWPRHAPINERLNLSWIIFVVAVINNDWWIAWTPSHKFHRRAGRWQHLPHNPVFWMHTAHRFRLLLF